MRFTTPQLELIQTIKDASDTAGTVTNIEWSDFLMIAGKYYQYWVSEIGLTEVIQDPEGIDWSASIGFTGFSADPTNVVARYGYTGKLAWIYLFMTPGTSNATTFTITGLPITPLRSQANPVRGSNNGANLAATCNLNLAAGSNTITCNLTFAGSGGWTAANTKGVSPLMIFFIME